MWFVKKNILSFKYCNFQGVKKLIPEISESWGNFARAEFLPSGHF